MMKMGAALRFVRHFFGIESSVESEGGVPIKRASSDSAKVVVRGGGVVLSNVPTSRQSTSRKSDTRPIGRCPDELDARSFQG